MTQTASWPCGVSAVAKKSLEQEESKLEEERKKLEEAAKAAEPPPPTTPADGADAAENAEGISAGQAGGQEDDDTLTPEELAAAVAVGEAGGEADGEAAEGEEGAAEVGVVMAGEEEGGELDAEEYKAAMEEAVVDAKAAEQGAVLKGAGDEEASSAVGHGEGWGKSGEELAKEIMDAARKKAEEERQAKRVMEQWVPGAKEDEEVAALEQAEAAAIETDAAAAGLEAELEERDQFFRDHADTHDGAPAATGGAGGVDGVAAEAPAPAPAAAAPAAVGPLGWAQALLARVLGKPPLQEAASTAELGERAGRSMHAWRQLAAAELCVALPPCPLLEWRPGAASHCQAGLVCNLLLSAGPC